MLIVIDLDNWAELTVEESFAIGGGGVWDGIIMIATGTATCIAAVGILAGAAVTAPVAAVATVVYFSGQMIVGGGIAKAAGAW
jgi:hypothetical protein